MEILRDTLQTRPLFPTFSNLSVKLMLKDSSIGITGASGVIQQFNIPLQRVAVSIKFWLRSGWKLSGLTMLSDERCRRFWEVLGELLSASQTIGPLAALQSFTVGFTATALRFHDFVWQRSRPKLWPMSYVPGPGSKSCMKNRRLSFS